MQDLGNWNKKKKRILSWKGYSIFSSKKTRIQTSVRVSKCSVKNVHVGSAFFFMSSLDFLWALCRISLQDTKERKEGSKQLISQCYSY